MSAEPEYDGREFLAVAALSGHAPGADIAGSDESTAPELPLITVSTLPLPYPLPT
jgi:hypothetical protein